MTLYPITILDAVDAVLEPNPILSGTETIIPIDMTTTLMTELTVFQMSNTQDFSLRAWLSKYQNGIALPSIGFATGGNYPIRRFGGVPIIIYVAGQSPPANTFPIEVTPGQYYLNILNLTNEQNIFGFTKTDLA